ncbi:MAG: MmcQ/YjbR family DNA-binding protein [Longimicrobiaceae bacterium]
MTLEDVRAMVRDLPGAVEAESRGVVSFTVQAKLFLRLMEDGRTLLLRTDPYERDYLLSTAPEVFYVDDPLREHPWVCARLDRAQPDQLRELVRDAWRRRAPPKVVEAFDARSQCHSHPADKEPDRCSNTAT